MRLACRALIVLIALPLLAADRPLAVVTDRTSLSAFRFDGPSGVLYDKFTTGVPVFAEYAAIGPDGEIYVTDIASRSVQKFESRTGRYLGQFVRAGSSPLGTPEGLAFGPDGNLYVADFEFSSVRRFDGTTGEFLSTFVPPGSAGLRNPIGIAFGPDGNLYVTSGTPAIVSAGALEPKVIRFSGATGEYIDDFVTTRSGGLDSPFGIVFGPDRNLYVSSVLTDNVLRYNGTTGEFIDVFVDPRSGGLQRPTGLAFGPDGDLYVASASGPNIGVLRYDGGSGAFVKVFIGGSADALRGPTSILFYNADVPVPMRRRSARP